ncbi:MAG: amidohydrolase family protein [Acidobacteria bacterium]|nr:amidohydrolase family protein [Acidobacteriota bacterium]
MGTRFLLLATLSLTLAAWAAGPPYAITNAKIVLSPDRSIAQGVIVLRDGLIQAVGENIAVPPDARVYDAKGLTVYPGLIDSYTHFGFPPPVRPTGGPQGGGGFGQASVPEDVNSPERYLAPKPVNLNADLSAAAKMAVSNQPDPRRNLGFTTVLAVPRDGNWQGSSALVNLAGAPSEMVVRASLAMHVSFGSQRGSYPSSLMGVFAVLRQTLLTAQQYRDALALYEKTGGRGIPRPGYDPVSAALLPVLDGKVPVMFAADRAEEIRRAVRFADEFHLRPMIYGGAEAWRVTELLKARDIPVLVDLAFRVPSAGGMFGARGGGAEAPANSPRRFDVESNPGRLEKASVRFAFASGSLDRPDQIPAQVRLAIQRGLSKGAALRALTSSPAEILGAGAQLGSLESGKIANLTLLDGEAFEANTKVKAVIIDGAFHFPSEAPAGMPAFRAGGGRPPAVAGKIKEAGKTVSAPGDARIIDASGRFVMPGIIDSHSHSAMSGGVNEMAPAITAQVRVADVLDPEDIDLYRALAGGTTTLNILHGSANAIGGQNATIKIKWGRPVEEMLFPGAPRGIKMALGENPKRSNFSQGTPRFPATRMGVENVIRESFTRAREYAKAWEDYEARKARGETVLPPRRNLTLDALRDVLAGKILVHAHCYRADEISMLLDLADEFGFKIRSLQHVLEGYKVMEKIKKHGAGASTFADNWGYKMEAWDGTAYNAALMAKFGIRTAVNSDSDERARRLYQEAAKTMKYGGLTETEALRTITMDPAWMLGIDQRVGSIEPGKDADLAIFNGHPFSPYARVEMTLIDGQVFFDRARDLEKRIPWKEEFDPEPETRPTRPTEVIQ